MQSMHRQFGKLMKRSADDSQVSMLLTDFDHADKLLTKIVEHTKAWRDAWTSILTNQGRLVHEFDALYAPMGGSSDTSSAEIPAATLARTRHLDQEFESLRADLSVDINSIDTRMIGPVQQAKELLGPIKKKIKKREDKKLDFEHFQSRVDSSSKKGKRSDRDEAVLAKAQAELAKAKEDYNAADDNLREYLPKLISAIFSLLPCLLASQVEIQNALLGHLYTALHTYAQAENFQSPPGPMEQAIQEWQVVFLPVQQEVESLATIANGKSVRGDDDRRSNNRQLLSSATSPNGNNPIKIGSRPRIGSRAPSSTSTTSTNQLSATTPTAEYASEAVSNGARGGGDYFTRERKPSSTSTTPGTSAYGTVAAAKKKPPPPPPPRQNSSLQPTYVTALYDFGGQGAGDLAFRGGDRIRVIRRTDSTDDWWEGELRGVKGSFPANYCQ